MLLTAYPIDTGRKLNVHKTFWTSYVRSIYVLCLWGSDVHIPTLMLWDTLLHETYTNFNQRREFHKMFSTNAEVYLEP